MLFLRNSNKEDKCNVETHYVDEVKTSTRYLVEQGEDIYIRDSVLLNIKNKAESKENFSKIVSAAKQYGLRNDFFKNPAKYNLPPINDKPIKDGYKILGLDEKLKRVIKYIPHDYPLPKRAGLLQYKAFISESYGCGAIGEGPATPGMACTETFLQIGPFDTQKEVENVIKYIKTKLFRCLVGIRKITQHATQTVYKYVPLQDFTTNSDIDWSKPISEIDQQLYKKYNLTAEEIAFIEKTINPME